MTVWNCVNASCRALINASRVPFDEKNSAKDFVKNRIDEDVDYIKILREPLRETVDFKMIDTILSNRDNRIT